MSDKQQSCVRVHKLAMLCLGFGMVLLLLLAYRNDFIGAQLTENAVAPVTTGSGAATGTGALQASGALVPSHGWLPKTPQRQLAEIIIAGVHDEVRAYTRRPESVGTLHGSAPEALGFFRGIIDELARWFGLQA